MKRFALRKLLTVMMMSAVAGLLLAAAALPGSLLVGLGLRSFTHPALPEILRTPLMAQRSDLYAGDGTTLITSFYTENRVIVPLHAIAPAVRHAIVAAEDTRFYHHKGVDARGVVRAFVANSRDGGPRQGASTLTMQYVRNVLASDPRLTKKQRTAATEISAGRKLREMRYALAVERELAKDEILNRYLNIVYFGAGAYGIEAASQRYFSKSAADLTLAEAALLAGLVRSPDTDDPISGDLEAARQRQSYVLDQMVAVGSIPAATAAAAKAEPIRLQPSNIPEGCTAVPDDHRDWGFFCDYLERWWSTQSAFGGTVKERQMALRRGGYRIVASLDLNMQAQTQRRVVGVYGYDNPRALPTAVVEPGTGQVLAMAVNRHYSLEANPEGQPNHPNTVNQLVAGGGAITGYQGGSTFKIFAILAALEAGLPLSTEINAPSRVITPWSVTGDSANCGGYWCPVNSTPSWMNGRRTMWSGFGRSVNTYFAQLAERVGADRVVSMAQRLGIKFRSEHDARLARDGARDWGTFILGVSATTPLDLANAYATLAADGTYCAPSPVTSVAYRDGRPVPGVGPQCRRVLAPDVARAAIDAARCPVGDQSAYRRCDGATAPRLYQALRRPVAGKTGSSEWNATETVVAVTPQLAVASIAANPDDPRDYVGLPVQARMVDVIAQVLAVGLQGQPVGVFPAPSRQRALGTTGAEVNRRPPTTRPDPAGRRPAARSDPAARQPAARN